MMNPNTFPGGGGATRPPSPTSSSSASATEGSGKKVRKPYTITKSREIWTDEEHDKFLEALQLFDRDWKKIEEFVGSKTVIQIRSHAQKYFLKVQKNGTLAHVPPPRPKRKATHPYPQNAPKSGLMPLPTSIGYQSSVGALIPGYASWDDTSTPMLMCSGEYTALRGAQADDIGSKGVGSLSSNSVSSLKTIGRAVSSLDIPKQGQKPQMIRGGVPDFPEVYSFLGNLFDPVGGGHGEKLKEMDPITCQTVLLLMNNIASNLCDPDCEPHRKVIWSYAVTIRTEGVTAEIQMSDCMLGIPLETEWSSSRSQRVYDN